MGECTAIAEQLSNRLADVLAEEQQRSHGNTLARQNPEKWLEVARKLVTGEESRYSLERKRVCNYDVAGRVQEAIWPKTEDLRGIVARKLAHAIKDGVDLDNELSAAIAENLGKKEYRGEICTRDRKENAQAVQILVSALSRVEGGPDKVVEHRGLKDYEELVAAAKAEAAKDNIMELEVVNDDND